MSNDHLITKTYKIMGGEFRFQCYLQAKLSRSEIEIIFDNASLEVKRIEDKFTDFRESPFNNINEMAGKSPCKVDEEIYQLIEKSIDISKQSKGLFDITYASIGHAWRSAKENGQTLTGIQRAELIEYIDYTKIKLNKENQSVFLPYSKMKIGMGGIGKGYAVDSVYNLFVKAGLSNFYVNGAGDIRVHSDPDAPRPWKIGIRNPMSKDPSKMVGIMQMTTGSVSTSGSYIQNIKNSKMSADHHILNPSTGESYYEIISSTILDKTCLESDTAATITMNMSVKDALKYMNKYELFGAIIDRKGTSHLSNKALKGFGH